MNSSTMTNELARKLESSEIKMFYSRLYTLKNMENNVLSVDIGQFGNTTAFSVENIPGPSYNTVKGLSAEDIDHIESIINFYKTKSIPARFEITPAHSSPQLLLTLHEAGYYHADFHTTMFASLNNQTELKQNIANSDIVIKNLKEDEFIIFADIYTQSFGMPVSYKNSVAKNNQILFPNKQWTFYLAYYCGEPAGIAVMYIEDDVANLAAAATLPPFRNKGIHLELIKKRVNDAILKQCNYIVGQAKFASVSQSNMARAGLNIAYTKAIWVSK